MTEPLTAAEARRAASALRAHHGGEVLDAIAAKLEALATDLDAKGRYEASLAWLNNFRERCEAEEYTDTGEAWELLDALGEALGEALREVTA